MQWAWLSGWLFPSLFPGCLLLTAPDPELGVGPVCSVHVRNGSSPSLYGPWAALRSLDFSICQIGSGVLDPSDLCGRCPGPLSFCVPMWWPMRTLHEPLCLIELAGPGCEAPPSGRRCLGQAGQARVSSLPSHSLYRSMMTSAGRTSTSRWGARLLLRACPCLWTRRMA